MGAWGFVYLAYGIVWGAILLYLYMLKRRCQDAQATLVRLQASEESGIDVKK
jgi:CcmD family protein